MRNLLALVALLFALPACQSFQRVKPARTVPVRAIWVTRFDFKTAADIERVIATCADAGFDRVNFQVRGNGSVFFDSKIEPWADELGGKDPGFDPLAVACDAAHDAGIELHAWVNVAPSWRGSTPPKNLDHVYHRHPEWHWFDAKGRRQPLEGFYVSLNPCLPAVRDYLVSLLREIATNYDVDGIHLDYIRFPNEEAKGVDYPRDRETLRLYRKDTGLAPDDDATAWATWRADQVTRLVADIRAMLDDENPRCELTAAVGASPEGPTSAHFRDSERWLREKLVAAVYPMNYTPDVATFTKRVHAWKPFDPNSIITGLRIDLNQPASTLEAEVAAATAFSPHLCVFAYASLFPGKISRDQIVTQQRLLAALRPVRE